MDPTVALHSRSVEESELAVDKLFALYLKDAVPAIVRDVAGDGPIQPQHHGAIMARVDRELSRIYPAGPGERSLLEEVVVDQANRARVRAIKAGIDPIVRILRRRDPKLLKAIRNVDRSTRTD